MVLLPIVLVSAVILIVAYFTYGRLLARLLDLDPNRPTPANTLRDDLDFIPTEPQFLLSQHFSAIAAAGPIVGPILAGIAFGWLPALIWILVGSILIGGVHDLTALVASIRHQARSIAEVVRDHMSKRSYLLFLAFIWIALVYIIVAFTDITAASFVGSQTLESGQEVTGAGIASSSLMYLALPIVMGLLLRYTRLTVGWATVLFLPLVGLAIWKGQAWPFDLGAMLGLSSETTTRQAWDVLLLGYCLVAGVLPVWMLLQPRGHLGGYFLYVALAAFGIGMVVGSGTEVKYPAFTGWTTAKGETLAPILFITIACGACSGFHSLIASGSTSKQLRVETDAKPIAYGAMLLEAMVAICSLCCVMMLTADSPLLTSGPNNIYANGLSTLLSGVGVGGLRLDPQLVVCFALMAFVTFVYDTLDVCTRLGRYIIQELTGLHNAAGRWLGTGLTAGVPLMFVMQTSLGPDGNPTPVWRTYWALFGASNQLLAALTLLGVTVWLWKTKRAAWVWLVVGLPAAWMYTVSTWALILMVRGNFLDGKDGWRITTTWVGLVLIALAALMLVEALRVLLSLGRSEPPRSMKSAMAPSA
ncbi:MAG: carbon starvation CstA family protein [Planctomycetia bacterium]|nr:carbon starvation CstA family protein [Planctomycetia bacterium]